MLNNLQIQVINDIAFENSTIDALITYCYCLDDLKGITIIKATDEEGAVNLYEPFEKIKDIKENLYTPFYNGKVYFLSERTLKTMNSRGITFTCEQRCISFDTQTISYLDRYYKGEEKEIPSNVKSILELMKLRRIGVDHIPYVMENLLLSNKNEESVKDTLLSFEALFHNGKRPLRNKMYVRRMLRNLESLRKDFDKKRMYYSLYRILMKMSYIQFRYSKKSLEEKMTMMCCFMKEEIGAMLFAELIVAKKYFERGQNYKFFGKIQKGRADLLESLKNMAWDLFHLRFLEYDCVWPTNPYADIFVPYFYTYDKRLLEVRECYMLQALAVNKHTRDHFPIYVHQNEIIPYIQKLGIMYNRERKPLLSEYEVQERIAKEEKMLLGVN